MKHAILFLCFISLTTMAAIAAPERTSTVNDREGVNLSIYNGNLALVHDRRKVRLNSGLNRIAWRDVSAIMDPTSALVEASGSGNRVDVLEQNFNFDLVDPNSLLQKAVGHNVVVVHDPQFAGQLETRETARVLSADNGIVLQYKDRIDETHLALTGLITLSNTSGASYDNARLQLVAGNVNVAPAPTMLREIAHVTSRSATADSYSVSEENYFDYHLYTVGHRTSILDKQTKQLTLLQARDVPAHKTLELRGSPYYYQSEQADLGSRLPIGTYVSFDNRDGDLGIPLPAGIVRLYKSDAHGLKQFLGSDRIGHTPRNEHVRLYLGDSFDLVARKRQTDYHLAGRCTADSAYELTIRNAKMSDQDVLVVEPFPGDWQITSENLSHTKSSSSTANWTVHVPADSHATLNYTAQVKWC
jgi:hypothetical protein